MIHDRFGNLLSPYHNSQCFSTKKGPSTQRCKKALHSHPAGLSPKHLRIAELKTKSDDHAAIGGSGSAAIAAVRADTGKTAGFSGRPQPPPRGVGRSVLVPNPGFIIRKSQRIFRAAVFTDISPEHFPF